MKSALALALFATLIGLSLQAGYASGPGCSASAQIKRRDSSGTWQDPQGRINSIYDLTVYNTGNCTVRSVQLTITIPSGWVGVESWNLEFQPPYAFLAGFGGYLHPGSSFHGAGLVLARAAGTAGQLSISVHSTGCDSSCWESDSSEHASSSEQESSSEHASSSEQESSEDSEGSHEPPHGCAVTVTVQKDIQGAWTDAQGRRNFVYNIGLANTGSCPVTSIKLNIAHNGALIQKWNLDNNNYAQNFGGSLAAGTSYNGIGFIIAGATQVTVTVADKVCTGCM